MKVLLIVRDKRKGGTSIEGIFETLRASSDHEIKFETWYYDSSKSLWSNMLALRNIQADIFHISGDIYYVALFLWNRTVVLTIHDIGAYKRFQGFKQWLYGKLWLYWPVRVAEGVIAVSEFTRQDLLRLIPGARRKIQVIHNGYNPRFEFTPKLYIEDPPRILVVGTAVHKNVETIIRMIDSKPYRLVIIGGPTEQQFEMLKAHQVQYEIYSNISTEELFQQYKQADILVFISLHEGFGMPVIEAQAVGLPVITTSMASIPEVAGKGAYYMKDPFDTLELTKIIDRLLKDVNYRNALIDMGRQNATHFTLEAMIRQYKKFYSLINQPDV